MSERPTSSVLIRLLDAVERLGNRLPDPALLDWRSRLMSHPPQEVYETDNLRVWPVLAGEAQALARACGLHPVSRPCYLNYYSRFSAGFVERHPIAARGLAAIEGLCRQLPVIRRAAITFMLRLRRGSG